MDIDSMEELFEQNQKSLRRFLEKENKSEEEIEKALVENRKKYIKLRIADINKELHGEDYGYVMELLAERQGLIMQYDELEEK